MAATKTRKSKKTAKKTKAETVYRVVPLPPFVRRKLAAARAKHGTNQAVIEHALYRILPHIISDLESAGFDKVLREKPKKYRLPLGTARDIEELNKASEHVGIAATTLLKVALWSLD